MLELIFYAVFLKEPIDLIGKGKNEILLFPSNGDRVYILKDKEMDTLFLYRKFENVREIASDDDYLYLNTGKEIMRIDKKKGEGRYIYKSSLPLKMFFSQKDMNIYIYTLSKIKKITRNGKTLLWFIFPLSPKEIMVKGDSVYFLDNNGFGIFYNGKLCFYKKGSYVSISQDSSMVFVFKRDYPSIFKMESFIYELSFPEIVDAEVSEGKVYILKNQNTVILESLDF